MIRTPPVNTATALACLLCVAAAGCTTLPSSNLPPASTTQPVPAQRAPAAKVPSSADARRVADRVVRTNDNRGLPFLIIDKVGASVTVFDAQGRVRAAAPVLLGIAKGDRFAPGSAEKDMYQTHVSERITPAGRFLAERGIDDKGREVVWISYDTGIALHAVLNNPGERRPERLRTATPDDNRISYGCVNVPTEFYAQVVRPLFARTKAVVYVLPDSAPALPFFSRQR